MSAATLERPRETARDGAARSITLRGLAKSYGGRSIIGDLDLHVPAGQFLAIVGRSGCGKSTLLRMIAGLETPDAGSVRFGGEDRPLVRLMFQEPRLLPWARVGANVEVGLDRASARADGARAATEALRAVGLADRADQWPAILSGGQKQRVALARALVSRPAVLALDEPLGALDALTRIEMQSLIERVHRDQGFTAVLVTHDVTEAVALADRVIMLDRGGIALDVVVPLARPRRGSAEAAALEAQILDRLLDGDQTAARSPAPATHPIESGDAA